MPKGSPELTAARKEEIMNACAKLYRTMSFKEITLKDVGEVTSFSRTSIYNYFQTKEEIFLGLFQREYELWCGQLEEILEDPRYYTAEELTDRIVDTLSERELMLKLLAVNLYDMEENSRLERLVELKKAYGRSMELMDQILGKHFPERSEAERRETVIALFEFLHGLYPYAYHTKKQEEAMKIAGITPVNTGIEELASAGLRRILA
ncbi:MAG: TetR/AcrR family transcriptional regulator [Lachnospiraceae bacterium]|nr:TetR/AcrR family transcriptional regulator [Lachnospiraceae bacterium]